jgi:hypothetical protein
MLVVHPMSSSWRSDLEADRLGSIEGRDQDRVVLLHFRSTSDVVRHQPDPYVLKQIITDLKCFRRRAAANQVPNELTRLVVHGIVDSFRKLDALPRRHPFWDHTNRRPTLSKLQQFSDHLLRDNPGDVAALRTALAFEILTFQNFHPRYWVQLHLIGQLDVSWPIYATLLLGADGFQAGNLVWFLKATGLCNEAVPTLEELIRTQNPLISEWAKNIIDCCSELSEGS